MSRSAATAPAAAATAAAATATATATAAAAALRPSAGFALRTPLLPFASLAALGEGMTAPALAADPARLPAALAADAAAVRARLRALVDDPVVREAVFLASPGLAAGLDAWRADPAGESAQKVERALLRYVARMSARATPFGLFAGLAAGTTGGARTALEVGPRAAHRRTTRLDAEIVCAIADALAARPDVRRALRYRPSSSVYELAGQVRYIEGRLAPRERARRYHLVAVAASAPLRTALARAAEGARPDELAAALRAAQPDLPPADAEAFVDELIDAQLLVPELPPAVTGDDAAAALAAALAALAAPAAPAAIAAPDTGAPAGLAREAAALDAARAGLAALDAGGLGQPAARYEAIAAALAPAAPEGEVELARLFQVDLSTAARATLGEPVLAALAGAAALLHRVAPPLPDALAAFRAAFVERWGEREVPLAAALDEQDGIPLDGRRRGGAAPLLDGIGLGAGAPAPAAHPFTARDAALLPRLERAWRTGARELVLDDADVDAIAAATGAPAPLPRSFALWATLAAPSRDALDRGDVTVLAHRTWGPSGANLLGRFCHADPAIERLVRDLVAEDEAGRPDAIHAEIVHLPVGRAGNILARPVLRDHEITFLGRSGAPPERQLPLDDLLLAVRGDRLVLRSRRLGREIVPRLSNAHSWNYPDCLAAYKLLCLLQQQGVSAECAWSWGALAACEALPRVRAGRVVLAPATWRLDQARLAALAAPGADAAARFTAVQRLRAELGWPRFVTVADGDQQLPVDLDCAPAVDGFVQLVKTRAECRVSELWPAPDELCAAGPDGRYAHELVVPFTAGAPAPGPRAVPPPPRAAGEAPAARAAGAPRPAVRRTFAPGGEWLYAKIYAGPTGVERVLRTAVAPLVAGLGGAVDRWFFVRYADPGWHLRLRLHADPRHPHDGLAPALAAALAPLLEAGVVHDVAHASYERELERYGGPAGIELAERLFTADSAAALEIVRRLGGAAGETARWRLALAGIDRLLADLALDVPARLAIARDWRAGLGAELGVGLETERRLGARFRAERAGLEALLAGEPGEAAEAADAPVLRAGLDALARRGEAVRRIAAELDAAGVSRAAIATSAVHMWANRVLRAASRPQELVLHDWLVRLYESRLARARGRGAPPRATAAAAG